MPLSLGIAVRFIIFNKLQSSFIVFGIGAGVAVLIFVGILIDSLQTTLIQRTIGKSPHITIVNNEDVVISAWQQLLQVIKGTPGISKTHPTVDGNTFLLAKDKNYPTVLRGFTFDPINDIYVIKDAMVEGRMPKSDREVIVGKVLYEDADLTIGDFITLKTATGSTTQFKIVGLFDLKIATPNKQWIITTREAAQEVFQLGNKITSIEAQVNEVFLANTIDVQIEEKLSKDYKVDNWKDLNAQLLSGLQGQTSSSMMIQVFVLLSVVIAIASILSITVTQKSRQIGILKAMGLTDGVSRDVFVFQGFILGSLGTLLGIIIGLGLFAMFAKFAKSSDGIPVVEASLRWSYVLMTGAASLLSAGIAGLFPASKSKKLNPIDIIRNG
jgi:lipoprotein-releasing system permease protein